MIGQQIQNYIIISQLGQGGMGTVYKAVDNVLGREVALKMLNTVMMNQPQVLERFKKEAQVLARLLHPNIAVIYNLIEQEQQHFMVMEYVEGNNLEELLRQHKALPYQMVVLIFMQALEGLHHAHKKGIYHRDIKPSNLILTPDGTVKLMDFGIAKVAGEQRMTQLNKVIGTIEFLAPEIIEGKEPSVASDIYAAAVTMYELLSGTLPFESNTDFSLMQEILKKKPIAVDKLNNTIPKALNNIVMKALEKKPENRFTDAGAFQDALANAFPDLRKVDLSSLNRQLETTSAPPLTQVIMQPRKNVNKGSVQATRLETQTRPGNILINLRTKATDTLRNIQDKYLQTTRSRVVVGSVLLLLILVLGFSIFSKHEKPNKEELVNNIQPKENIITNSKDKNTGNNNSIDNSVIPIPENNIQTPTNPPAIVQQPVNDQAKKDKERKDKEKRDQERKDQERKDQEKIDQERREQERKDQEKRDQEKKDIYIGSDNVKVYLYLDDNLEGVPKRKDIPVSFTVTRPVIFGGTIIIKQGATAKGIIRVGVSRDDIIINTVTAANGQQIRLKSVEAHRNPREVISDHNFSASIQPGTRINF